MDRTRYPCLLQLDTKVNNNSIFKTKYAAFSTKWSVPIHFHNRTCAYNHPEISKVNFYLHISPLLVHKVILTITTNTTFLYTSAIFYLPIFAHNHYKNLHQKHFPCLSHLAIQAASRDQNARESCKN